MKNFDIIIPIIFSIINIIFSLYIYFKHGRQLNDQQKLINEYSIREINDKEILSKKALLRATTAKNENEEHSYRLIIQNDGADVARNINLRIRQVGVHFFQEPFPIEFLNPGDSIAMVYTPCIGCDSKMYLKFTWKDQFSENNERDQIITII